MKAKIITALFLGILFISCQNTGRVLPSATGARFELLVVMGNSQWQSPAGKAVFNLFDEDMEGLPQPEPIMNIKQVNHANFSDILKPSRNILYTEISDKYVQPKITYSKDYYSYPQAFVRVVAPNDSIFKETIEKYGNNIRNFFVLAERERTMTFNKKDLNQKAVQEVKDQFNIEIDIPVDLKRATKGDDFYWITNDNGYIRQDLVVYSYPYTDPNTFTYEYLTAKRDSVMKYNIPGEFEGSYMGTEYRYAQPNMKEVNVNGEYAVEMRGLWKVLNGGGMGGPFVSLTRLDEVNQRIITVEGFVFAPATTKRNPIRALEAVVYSTRLPQDLNVLEEVVINTSQAESTNEK